MPRVPASLSERLARSAPLILDGATGTELERRGGATTLPLWSADALLQAPALVGRIHRDYAEAGAQALTANSFRTQRRSARAQRARGAGGGAHGPRRRAGTRGRSERAVAPARARLGSTARGLLPPRSRPGRGRARERARRALRESRGGGGRRDPLRDAEQRARGPRGGARRERDGAAGARELRLLARRHAALGRMARRCRTRPCASCARLRCS